MLSDTLINILKKHLLDYTNEKCELLNIKTTQSVPSGYFWDEKTCQWENEYTNRLIIDSKPILLVPKKIVNYSLDGSSYQYKQHFVLNYLQEENIKNRTNLVRQRNKIKEVSEAPNKPYYLSDKGLKPSGVYLRHKNASVQANEEVIKKLLIESNSNSFESNVSRVQDLHFEY